MKGFIVVFLGGGLGSMLRYLISVLVTNREAISGFPWPTFIVNIAGSLLIGIFYSLSVRFAFSQETRLFLTVGLCGGFTTFSTFSNESLLLLKAELYGTFALYALSSVGLGILAVMAGSFMVSKV